MQYCRIAVLCLIGGILDGIGCIGVTELSLNCCDIAGFLDEVPAHGVAGVMGRVAIDAGQAANLAELCIDHPGVETTVAMGVGISKLIDFTLYFQDNAWNSAQKNFPIYRLIK